MKLSNRFVFLTTLVCIAAATRLMPHYPNFTAIGALALFGGANFTKKWEAFVVPFIAMFVTDIIIGFHPGMYAVYASFALIVAVGFFVRSRKTVSTVALASVFASVSFFVITNFAYWASGVFYPRTSAGLAQCFLAAVPFFHYNMLGDLFFSAALFGTYELAQVKFPVLVKA